MKLIKFWSSQYPLNHSYVPKEITISYHFIFHPKVPNKHTVGFSSAIQLDNQTWHWVDDFRALDWIVHCHSPLQCESQPKQNPMRSSKPKPPMIFQQQPSSSDLPKKPHQKSPWRSYKVGTPLMLCLLMNITPMNTIVIDINIYIYIQQNNSDHSYHKHPYSENCWSYI